MALHCIYENLILEKDSRKKILAKLLEKEEWTVAERAWLLEYLEHSDQEVLQEIMLSRFLDGPYEETDNGRAEELLQQLHQQIDQQENRSKYVRLRRWSVAASVLILLAAGTGYFVQRSATKNLAQAREEAAPKKILDVAPGHNNAILTLSDGSHIVLDNAGDGTLASEGGIRVLKMQDQISYQGAKASSGEIFYNTVRTANANRYQLILSDGTKVWLNAASSIRFPTVFQGKERHVDVRGEAYFEVTHNAARPFRVTIHRNANDSSEVMVLGTHFNINSYSDEPVTAVTLLEGSVQVFHGRESSLLKPGQQARLQSDFIRVARQVDPQQVVAWKEGYFWFNNTDIRSLMRQVSRWYNVEVKFGDRISTEGFSGKIPMNLPLSKFLEVLRLNDVRIESDGKHITVGK